MSKSFVILLMIFCHIVDDYYLQGWLASAKQKEWWQKNAPQPMYEYDYIWALLMHSFSWSFMIMLPIAFYMSFNIDWAFICLIVVNTTFHTVIDDGKANKKLINLWVDQLLHMLQIAVTAGTLMFL